LPVHSAVALTSTHALGSGVRKKIEFDVPPPGSGIAMVKSATLTGVYTAQVGNAGWARAGPLKASAPTQTAAVTAMSDNNAAVSARTVCFAIEKRCLFCGYFRN
jgi:hypothetical protein